jgi:hypothetical protein
MASPESPSSPMSLYDELSADDMEQGQGQGQDGDNVSFTSDIEPVSVSLNALCLIMGVGPIGRRGKRVKGMGGKWKRTSGKGVRGGPKERK